MDRKRVLAYQLKSLNFYINCFSILALFLLLVVDEITSLVTIFIFLLFLKLYSLNSLDKNIKLMISGNFWLKTSDMIVKNFFIIFMIAHLISCLYMGLGLSQIKHGIDKKSSWISVFKAEAG